MNDFLKKIKLVDSLTLTLPISQKAFIKKLSAVTQKGDFGLFAPSFEVFTDSHKVFKGYLYDNGFKIRRRRQFFDTNPYLAFADGTITQQGDNIILEVEIDSLNFQVFLGTIAWVLMFSTFFINVAYSYSYLMLGLFLLLGVVIGYVALVRSVNKLKFQLEREFFYLANS